MAKQRVPVSARAILQRINRKLKPDWKQLKTGRGLLLERTVGRYYVIDIRRNCVTQQYVDVEDLARELKVLLRRQMRSPDLSRPPLAPNQSWEELLAESGVAGAGKRQGSQRKVATRTRLRQNPNDVSDSIGYILKRARHSQVFLDVLFLTSN